MTETLFERASQLVEHKRYEDAEKHLKEILAVEPNHTNAIVLLALCRSELGKHKEAVAIIQQAVRQQSDNDYVLYLYALFLFRDDQVKEAEKIIKSALAFNPTKSGYFGLVAAINLQQKEWQEALDHANKGLALDAQDLTCLNIRSTALLKLNKKEEAYATIHEALNQDPENDFTHANTGWGMLEKGDHKKALEHFREALKLNPENDLAKAGLVEALKARYLFYRLFLKYALWISNLKGGAQWAVILGLYFGVRLLRSIAENNAAFAPFLYPIIFLYTLFAVSTWIIGPLSNLFLRLNVYGRYALTEDETESSNYVGISLGLGLLGFLMYLFTQNFVFMMLGIFGVSMMIPLATMFNPVKSSSKKILIAYTIALGVIGGFAMVQQSLTGDAGVLPVVYIFGIVAYQWIANALMIR
jgi:tetratricopeptide (TPR) repeat protein